MAAPRRPWVAYPPDERARSFASLEAARAFAQAAADRTGKPVYAYLRGTRNSCGFKVAPGADRAHREDQDAAQAVGLGDAGLEED